MEMKPFHLFKDGELVKVPDFPGWITMGIDYPIKQGDVFVQPLMKNGKSTPETGDLCKEHHIGAIPREAFHICEHDRWCLYRPINGLTKQFHLNGNAIYAEPLPLP